MYTSVNVCLHYARADLMSKLAIISNAGGILLTLRISLELRCEEQFSAELKPRHQGSIHLNTYALAAGGPWIY